MLYRFILAFAFCLFTTFVGAQVSEKNPENVIQFSGVVVTADSLRALPYTNILIVNKGIGTSTDYYGYFSFAAELGDSILFSSVGYKRAYYQIPDTLTDNKYSIVQVMNSDTVYLTETVIYPWPTPDEFKEAFLALNVADDEIARAQKNLDPRVLYKRMLEMPMDGTANYKYQMQQIQNRLYYAGQAPPIQLLNPFAWAQFFKAWQEGKFKREKN
ncbi:carboxypeptidase-like regulatory domain-containing protein [Luteibaculum oceani]|uniref:Carboxypeptidase-like regulatory domain-containing protein n=1 Tax=Luteibaculum oceani TaxID=1294296 RepID=A0A5C6UU79_9FLAO|nr:carboxypeptidase-like regulatory domain-containing protein [Luteibaculum oceani]TXC76912.1 carboxypeptidase-like regulatory domain-containing protein [Luteibaculum oceani]